ncbi:helix-turn-helix transcriptional regulator [Syntrophothermus sp.]|uniref:helix-turn-helix transcriptional regulator n=1 Tax=Syntrophothermus sp. TaxID=2736299 RepID=UPI00257CB973|nr:helix-turn-helix transcriptional regulator [Syntrophothermus sp.]
MSSVLKQARLAAGLTQAALAARVGLSRSAYANIEQGRKSPSLEVAIRLAAALGRPVEELFAASPSAKRNCCA